MEGFGVGPWAGTKAQAEVEYQVVDVRERAESSELWTYERQSYAGNPALSEQWKHHTASTVFHGAGTKLEGYGEAPAYAQHPYEARGGDPDNLFTASPLSTPGTSSEAAPPPNPQKRRRVAVVCLSRATTSTVCANL